MHNYNTYNSQPGGFRRFYQKHPVLVNFIAAILAAILLIYLLLVFLDFWTLHGESRTVPNLKGTQYTEAQRRLDDEDLKASVTDSIYPSKLPVELRGKVRPGDVVDIYPHPGSIVKPGANIYLTIVSVSPELITVPDYRNVSVRQARVFFENAGLSPSNIVELPTPSEYKGLVIEAKYNGVTLSPGARIPADAHVNLYVGSGSTTDDIFDEMYTEEESEEIIEPSESDADPEPEYITIE